MRQEKGKSRIDYSKKSPYYRQRVDKNSKDGKMAKQMQKSVAKEGKKRTQANARDDGSKKRQENPQPKKTDESKRNSVPVKRLTRPYARKTACIDTEVSRANSVF